MCMFFSRSQSCHQRNYGDFEGNREKSVPRTEKKKDVKSHREFLQQTFTLRRIEILDKPCPIKDVLEKYPSLQQFVHVSTGTHCIYKIHQYSFRQNNNYKRELFCLQ